MSFVCPIHGYYAPIPGTSVALCPSCQSKLAAPAIQQQPSRCPVCEGRGHVPNGFYRSTAGQAWSSGSTTPERCRACDGTGVVWSSVEFTNACARPDHAEPTTTNPGPKGSSPNPAAAALSQEGEG